MSTYIDIYFTIFDIKTKKLCILTDKEHTNEHQGKTKKLQLLFLQDLIIFSMPFRLTQSNRWPA